MRSLRGWLAAAHPFPLAMVLVLTALIGVASSGGRPDGTRLALAVLAMAFAQLAIGWSNDYLDRDTDALHQRWKPVPSGLVDARRLPPAIAVALVASILVGAFLGPVPLLLLIAGTACGLAYNLGLKDTRLSALPFVAGLALLPAYVWSALDVYEDGFLWLYVIGTPLALAAHLANTFPDIDADMEAGRAGLAARVGQRRCLQGIAASLSVAGLLFLIGPDRPVFNSAEGWWSFFAYLALCIAAAVVYRAPSVRGGEVWGFRLVALSGVTLATGWLASV
jgi:4-hydroxybenzoate polyprenyltransferase